MLYVLCSLSAYRQSRATHLASPRIAHTKASFLANLTVVLISLANMEGVAYLVPHARSMLLDSLDCGRIRAIRCTAQLASSRGAHSPSALARMRSYDKPPLHHAHAGALEANQVKQRRTRRMRT